MFMILILIVLSTISNFFLMVSATQCSLLSHLQCSQPKGNLFKYNYVCTFSQRLTLVRSLNHTFSQRLTLVRIVNSSGVSVETRWKVVYTTEFPMEGRTIPLT